MTDTLQQIQDLQLKMWLSKSPGERLYQAVKTNGELFLFFKEGKKQVAKIRAQAKADRS
jgi:hypothetical protein